MKTLKPLPELRDIQVLIDRLTELKERGAMLQGFKVTMRSDVASLTYAWGELRQYGSWGKRPAPVSGAEGGEAK